MIHRGASAAFVFLMAGLAWGRADGASAADGYLARGAAPDMIAVLPPPPGPGSNAEAADRAAFAASRPLRGSPRWSLAINDAALTPSAAFRDFACALGVTLDEGKAPALSNLLGRVGADARALIDPPKDHYARHRPYLDQAGPICVDRTPALGASASYPSGHATLSWAWGLILAEIAPERATQVLTRARVYGESRVACGVHYPSDIEAGRVNGAALVAALHSSAAFRADMDKARTEVEAARKAGAAMPDPGQCKVEADAAAVRPW